LNAAAGAPVAVHQFIPTLNPHDAAGTHTLMMRDILRGAGWRSEIFAETIHDDLASEAYEHWMYPGHAAERDVAIYQFTTSSAVAGYLAERPMPLILGYHNVTSPEHFAVCERNREARAVEELRQLAPRAALGLAVSAYSEVRLRRAGCRRTAVVPVLADYGRVVEEPDPRVVAELQAAKVRAGGGIDVLFVGRVVPSKAQHELVKALWAYRRLYDLRARLHIVGGTTSFRYLEAVRGLVDDLGLTEAVRIVGEVSDASLAAYYGAADVYLSLSEHEGFGVPLLEAMTAGVPVVARGAGAIPETVGGAALLLSSGDPTYVAAALQRVCTDEALRSFLVASGLTRLGELTGDDVARRVIAAVSEVAGPAR
jgi:glycosyltransferase involved in cell wall biosynthesis